MWLLPFVKHAGRGGGAGEQSSGTEGSPEDPGLGQEVPGDSSRGSLFPHLQVITSKISSIANLSGFKTSEDVGIDPPPGGHLLKLGDGQCP